MPTYTPRTGDVFVRAFDEGVMLRLGATIQTVGTRRAYFVSIPAASPSTVPVIWNNPEQPYEKKVYPLISINRDSVEPAMQRWQSVKQTQYVAGVSGTERIVTLGNKQVSGFGSIEEKPQAYPYDLFYTIAAYARYEHEAMPMIREILRRFPPYSRIFVTDTLGSTRSYTVFGQSGIQDLSEYTDVADRVRAYSISIKVEGELDLQDPITLDTVLNFETSIKRK